MSAQLYIVILHSATDEQWGRPCHAWQARDLAIQLRRETGLRVSVIPAK
jgi:hypothetical protein